ncbi:hypothetical protein K3495_g139 [Podosphaera aphanis]|nr:hypothetical protein K3495_g139 [Podosphaera aphanis]
MCSGNFSARFSYADDIGILGIGRAAAESAAVAQREVDELLEWASNNAVLFDTGESEAISSQGSEEKILLDPVSCEAVPEPLVAAVDSCVVPVTTFAAGVWWPGLKRPTKHGDVALPTAGLYNLIDRPVRVALRAALPVWGTTPNVILHREGGIPPARILLKSSCLRLAARINSLDTHHPLRSRASICPSVGTLKYKRMVVLSKHPESQMTRLQRAFRQLPPSSESVESLLAPLYSQSQSTKAESIINHENWIQTIPSSVICAYSDGSSERMEDLPGDSSCSAGALLLRKIKGFYMEKCTMPNFLGNHDTPSCALHKTKQGENLCSFGKSSCSPGSSDWKDDLLS